MIVELWMGEPRLMVLQAKDGLGEDIDKAWQIVDRRTGKNLSPLIYTAMEADEYLKNINEFIADCDRCNNAPSKGEDLPEVCHECSPEKSGFKTGFVPKIRDNDNMCPSEVFISLLCDSSGKVVIPGSSIDAHSIYEAIQTTKIIEKFVESIEFSYKGKKKH
jgi:hypothetical protein